MTSHYKKGVPNPQNSIHRPHLLSALRDVLDYRVTLFNAPPGCGKSTLVAQLAQTVNCSVIWHSITRYQQDIRVMVSQLLSTFADFMPDMASMNSLLEQPPEILAHELSLLLREHITEPFLMVLDDWHLYTTQHPANQWLKTFVSLMPANCHLVIISQSIPPLDLISMVARREVLAIAQEDLFFTEAEVYLLASKSQHTIPPQAIEMIWDSMHGWPAGTILALQPLPESLLNQLGTDLSPSESLFQSIARDMFRQQAPDVQDFLKWTSTLDSFTANDCNEVLNLIDWQQPLAEVLRNNLFIQEDGIGYRYHQLFRTFLQAHFRLTQPEEFASAHRRVAGWYQSQGLLDRAIEHFLHAQAYDVAFDLLESIVHSYFIQGRIETLRYFGQKLSDIDYGIPHFDYIRARIALDYDRDANQAHHYIDRALADFEPESEWHYWAVYQKANIFFFEGEYRSARIICHHISRQIEAYPDLYGRVLARYAMCLYMNGKAYYALPLLEHALYLLEQHSGMYEQSNVLQDLEIVCRVVNAHQLADEYLHRLVDLRRKLDNREQLALALNNLGYRYYELGLFNDAREAYLEGLDAVQYLESGRSQYFLSASLADLERDCGYYDKALENYQKALLLVGDENEPYMRCETLTHLATLYRWQDRHETALTCIQNAMMIANSHKLPNIHQQAKIESLHIKLQPWHVRSIQNGIKQLSGEYESVELLILRLCLANLQNDEVATYQILQTFIQRAQVGETLQFLAAELMNNNILKDLYNNLLQKNNEIADHLKKLRMASNRSAQRVIIPIKPPVSHIQVFTLGSEIIRVDNERLSDKEWNSSLAREMFLYFVLHNRVERDTILTVFWPDKARDAAVNLFHQMLGRMRQVVGNQTILYDDEQDVYYINPKVHVWCDAVRLDTLINEAKKLGPSSSRRLEIWLQATQLLTGEFLPSFDRKWISSRREKYVTFTIEAWMNLATSYMSQKNYANALQAYQIAAEHDDLYEAAFRGQMACWDKLGERAKVIHVFDTLAHNLKKQLGVPPSDKTMDLLDTLIG